VAASATAWHLEVVFVKTCGNTHDLGRAVGQESEVVGSYVTKTRGQASALIFLKRGMRRRGNPHVVVTD